MKRRTTHRRTFILTPDQSQTTPQAVVIESGKKHLLLTRCPWHRGRGASVSINVNAKRFACGVCRLEGDVHEPH